MNILAVNVGSSSIKYAYGDQRGAAAGVEEVVRKFEREKIAAVAHRIVHGGEIFCDPVVVTPQVLEKLKALAPLAPLHEPFNIAGIETALRLLPGVPQVACFDTMFHVKSADPLHAAYALPKALRDKGIRRYGFHGLSYAWIARVLKRDHPKLAAGRVIAAHLGSGASLCALKNGASVDTTMGLTALDGLAMGTRCGALDPGAVIYMMRNLGLGADEVESILYHDSGLKGLSGISDDVRVLLASPAPEAKFALDYFCARAAKFMAMMAASLGGVDGIVFTGGIGEHAEALRADILQRVAFLGPVETLVIPANEEQVMIDMAAALAA